MSQGHLSVGRAGADAALLHQHNLERVLTAAKRSSECTNPRVVEVRRGMERGGQGIVDHYEYRACGKCLSCELAAALAALESESKSADKGKSNQ